MGDIVALLDHLNLSPVNTLLLVSLVLAVKYIVGDTQRRLSVLERNTARHGRSISWIKGHIDGEEPQDEEDDE